MLLQRFAAWIVKRRGLVLGVLGVLTLISAVLLPRLTFDFRPEAMLKFDEEEERFSDDFERRFDTNDYNLLLVLHGAPDSIPTQDGLTLLYQLTTLVETSEAIEGSYSLARVPRRDVSGGILNLLSSGKPPPMIKELPVTPEDVERIKKEISASKLISGNLISKDGSTALVIARVKPEWSTAAKLDKPLKKLEELAASLAATHKGFSVSWGGVPYVNTATVRLTESEQLIFWPIVGASYFLLLLIIFRRFSQALLPMLVVGIATLWSVGLMAAVGMPIDLINNTVPKLILVVGVSNAIQVISRLIEEDSRGLGRMEAVQKAIVGIGVTSFLTTSTAAVGFGALLVAHSAVLRGFGWITAASIMLTYIAIAFLMPLLASYFQSANAREEKTYFSHVLFQLSHKLIQWPKATLLASLVALGVCIFFGLRVNVDARVLDAFEEGHPINEANKLIERQLGGILPIEVDLQSTPGTFGKAPVLQKILEFQQEASQLPGVLSTLSVADVLQEASLSGASVAQDQATADTSFRLLRVFQKEALSQFVTDDLSSTHITVRMPDEGNKKSLVVVEEIKALAQKHFGQASPEIRYRLTGVGYLAPIGLGVFIDDLFMSLLTATIIIFVGLFLVYRSWRVVVIGILPNLLPLALTLATMPLFGYELNTSSAMVFSISLGLSVDNTINIISRFREYERNGATREEAIRAAMRTAGWAIIASNLLLIGGFAALLFSSFEPIRRVAVLTMVTIAASLIVALLTLPPQLWLLGTSKPKAAP